MDYKSVGPPKSCGRGSVTKRQQQNDKELALFCFVKDAVSSVPLSSVPLDGTKFILASSLQSIQFGIKSLLFFF